MYDVMKMSERLHGKLDKRKVDLVRGNPDKDDKEFIDSSTFLVLASITADLNIDYIQVFILSCPESPVYQEGPPGCSCWDEAQAVAGLEKGTKSVLSMIPFQKL